MTSVLRGLFYWIRFHVLTDWGTKRPVWGLNWVTIDQIWCWSRVILHEDFLFLFSFSLKLIMTWTAISWFGQWATSDCAMEFFRLYNNFHFCRSRFWQFHCLLRWPSINNESIHKGFWWGSRRQLIFSDLDLKWGMAAQSAFKKDLSLGKISRTTMAWLLLLNPMGKGYTKDSYDKDVSHKGGKRCGTKQ